MRKYNINIPICRFLQLVLSVGAGASSGRRVEDRYNTVIFGWTYFALALGTTTSQLTLLMSWLPTRPTIQSWIYILRGSLSDS